MSWMDCRCGPIMACNNLTTYSSANYRPNSHSRFDESPLHFCLICIVLSCALFTHFIYIASALGLCSAHALSSNLQTTIASPFVRHLVSVPSLPICKLVRIFPLTFNGNETWPFPLLVPYFRLGRAIKGRMFLAQPGTFWPSCEFVYRSLIPSWSKSSTTTGARTAYRTFLNRSRIWMNASLVHTLGAIRLQSQ